MRDMVEEGMGMGAAAAQYCFGMCQMTNIFEKDPKKREEVHSLKLVEFYEFLGRIAFEKFKGSEMEDQLDLSEKIEYVLDDLLPLAGCTREEREEESMVIGEETCSDDY